jgi:hypothetical protein
MSFWDDRLGPAKSAQPDPQPAAKGAWWQTPAQRQETAPQVQQVQGQQQPQQGQMEYAPRSSGLVKNRLQSDVADTCPRCNSYEYIKIAAEPAAGSVYALPGSSMRCMACNYPGIDTSEGVLGGPTGFVPTGGSTDANTLKVRERGGRNQNSFAGFNESSQADGSHVIRIM